MKNSNLRVRVRADVAKMKGFRAEGLAFAHVYSGKPDNIPFAVAEMRRAITLNRFFASLSGLRAV